MFDRESLMEVDLLYAPGTDSEALSERIRTLLTQRHGNEDFTIITQDQMPRTATGKILHRILRESFADGEPVFPETDSCQVTEE